MHSGDRLAAAAGENQREHQASPGKRVSVPTACKPGATQLYPAFGLADIYVPDAEYAVDIEGARPAILPITFAPSSA
jgi:hypothetical protein